MTTRTLHGIYLITNDDALSDLFPKLDAAMQAGIALIQYRRKKTPAHLQEQEAQQILILSKHYNVPLVINDNVDLAERLQCGVHLGQGDGSLVEARKRLGQNAIIGRTCHNSLELAFDAAEQGASYLAFGAVFPSLTKPNAQQVSFKILAKAKAMFELPICAIGGLTVENIESVKSSGVDLYAVVSDILDLPVSQVGQRVNLWNQVINDQI
jgi:thiamine-phosphate pyrophosphorylase